MDKTTNFVFHVVVICLICAPFTTNATFTINKRTYTKDDKCLVDVRVEGNGVDYTATETCADVGNMKLRYFSSGLVLGDYRSNSLCVHTDTPGELVVIKDQTCSNVTRSTEGEIKGKEEGRTGPRVDSMSPAECTAAKQRVEEEWESTVHIGVMENTVGDVNLIRRRYVQLGTCTQELHLKGNGSDTSLAMSCEKAEGLEVLHTPQGMVLGDHRKNEVCVVVSDAVGLVIIQGSGTGKVCRREFSSGEGVGEEILPKEKCDDAKRTVETMWDNNRKDFNISRKIKYTKKNRCVEEFTFLGKGVDASIKVKCEVGQKLDILKLGEVFIIGDYRLSPICVFNNSPTSLVAIKEEDGYKVCREDVFEEEVSRRTLLPFDCATAKQFVKDRWDGATGNNLPSTAAKSK